MDREELQRSIRAEAELLKTQIAREERMLSGLLDAPGGDPDASALFPVAPLLLPGLEFCPLPVSRPDGSYHYRQFAAFEGAAFVDAAYRALPRHAPDPAGAAFYTDMLRAGRKKAEVLVRLRFSHEGRVQRVSLRGLLFPAALAALGYVPILGACLNWFIELVRLPWTMRTIRWQQEELRQHINRSCERLKSKTNEQSRVLNALLAAPDRDAHRP